MSDKLSFEKALEALEKLVDDLEKGDLPLEEAVKKYEEGMRLSKQCKTMLEKAEAALVRVMNENDEETDIDEN